MPQSESLDFYMPFPSEKDTQAPSAESKSEFSADFLRDNKKVQKVFCESQGIENYHDAKAGDVDWPVWLREHLPDIVNPNTKQYSDNVSEGTIHLLVNTLRLGEMLNPAASVIGLYMAARGFKLNEGAFISYLLDENGTITIHCYNQITKVEAFNVDDAGRVTLPNGQSTKAENLNREFNFSITCTVKLNAEFPYRATISSFHNLPKSLLPDNAPLSKLVAESNQHQMRMQLADKVRAFKKQFQDLGEMEGIEQFTLPLEDLQPEGVETFARLIDAKQSKFPEASQVLTSIAQECRELLQSWQDKYTLRSTADPAETLPLWPSEEQLRTDHQPR